MVVLGRIAAPYGVAGWVRLHAFGDDPDSWRRMARLWLHRDADGDDWQSYDLKGLRYHAKGWVAQLGGVDDRDTAEKLEGFFVGAPREALPETLPGEYYWSDLIGLRVENQHGEGLGRVCRLIESGANAVLVVGEGEGDKAQERLLPFVAAVVKDVDPVQGCIRVEWERDW
jgi:16S rRNA processing protein RimM